MVMGSPADGVRVTSQDTGDKHQVATDRRKDTLRPTQSASDVSKNVQNGSLSPRPPSSRGGAVRYQPRPRVKRPANNHILQDLYERSETERIKLRQLDGGAHSHLAEDRVPLHRPVMAARPLSRAASVKASPTRDFGPGRQAQGHSSSLDERTDGRPDSQLDRYSITSFSTVNSQSPSRRSMSSRSSRADEKEVERISKLVKKKL